MLRTGAEAWTASINAVWGSAIVVVQTATAGSPRRQRTCESMTRLVSIEAGSGWLRSGPPEGRTVQTFSYDQTAEPDEP